MRPSVLLALLAPLTVPAAGQGVSAQEASAAAAVAAHGKGGLSVTRAELDRLLLERYSGSEDGRELLDLLMKARVLETLAAEASLEVEDGEISRLWRELDRRARAAGEPRGLVAEIERRRLGLEEFREFLRLSILQERLTRRALGLDEDAELSGDQQELWLQSEMQSRGLELPAPPWEQGVIARCGGVSVGVEEFATFLHHRLTEEEVEEAAWHLLLWKGLERRMPDLSEEALERGIDEEIERRRVKHAAEYPGLSFEQRLGATGRDLDLLRRDPAVLIATLSRLWVDREHGPEGLRRTYEEERAWFEGRYGRAALLHMLFLVAGRFVNELNPRTFDDAERELLELRSRIGNLDDFRALVEELSEEPSTKKSGGTLGWITRADPRVPAALRAAAFEFLDTGGEVPIEGAAIGPVRTDAGCALLWLSRVRESPSWEEMSFHVHEELRRRLVDDVMPPSSVEVLAEDEEKG